LRLRVGSEAFLEDGEDVLHSLEFVRDIHEQAEAASVILLFDLDRERSIRPWIRSRFATASLRKKCARTAASVSGGTGAGSSMEASPVWIRVVKGTVHSC